MKKVIIFLVIAGLMASGAWFLISRTTESGKIVAYELLNTIEYDGQGHYFQQATGTMVVQKELLQSGDVAYTYCFAADVSADGGKNVAQLTFLPVSITRDPQSERNAVSDPMGPIQFEFGQKGFRVLRSGSFNLPADAVRSAYCEVSEPQYANYYVGFRPARVSTKMRGTIGISVLTLEIPYFQVIVDSMKELAAKHGYEVIVTDADLDHSSQQDQIKNFIAQGVSAIAFSPVDSKAIGSSIQEANKADVPVFTFDTRSTAEDARVVSQIVSDNYGGGEKAGMAMIEAMGKAGGKVAILHFKLANSCIERVNGFSDAIDAHNAKNKTGKIQIVAELPGGAAKDESYHATRDALQAYPDLAGIFAINDPSALGAVAAIEEVNKADQVKIIGFDGSLNGRQAIKEGRIIAAPIHFPERMGVQTMKTMIKYLKGKKVASEQLIPMELYRRVDAQKDPSLEALE